MSKKTKQARPVYYFEHYPHMSGTYNALIKIPAKKFEELCEAAATFQEDKLDNLETEIEKLTNSRLFVLTQPLIYPDPARSDKQDAKKAVAKVKRALAKKGVYGFEWEEGSGAFGYSKQAVKDAIMKLELKFAEAGLELDV